ncbi:hypothetical protein ABS648_24545 [Pseudomonas solani]|uniref:Pyosin/cloacin translocation domain-containing protein n=1 Tax=Pseudomonas solani TaxID=2731552 RepID=A0AAU7XYJ7_9PSED
MTTFNVNAEDDIEGKTMRVFLKPNPQADYHPSAWQVPSGAAGATEPFVYEAVIETDISSIAEKVVNPLPLGMTPLPSDGLQMVSPKEMSRLPGSQTLTPQQSGVINQSTPYIPFDNNWYVNDRPVVTMPYVDPNMTVGFEYQPNFYFMVATPPMIGQTYIVQNFSDMTQYVAPITATEVDVTLSHPNGPWRFDFNAS